MIEIWQVLKWLTDNKPNNDTHIITDNGRASVSKHQKADAFMNVYMSVISLKLTKEVRGVKRIHSRTLWTLEVTNGTWTGIVSDSVSTLQRMQNLHLSQQVANSDENKILNALVSLTERGCHLTFTCCPSHSGVCGNKLADVPAKEGTTVEQE